MTTDADIDALARRFEAAAIPHAEWTHAAHLTVGAWYVARFGPEEALVRLRAGIRRLNDRHGTPSSPTRGYHETVTGAYARLIAHFLAASPEGTSLAARVKHLLQSDLGARDALLAYYTRETLLSPRARAEWVEPDRCPLV
jgi:hypothetical protein